LSRFPQLKARELIKFLKSNGYVENRQSGSHLILTNPEKNNSVTIPIHTGADIGKGLAIRIIKDTGFSVDEYKEFKK